ncbi:MAG: nucleotidyl transferase AbiEii/AbiGii toxin family protein [Polyangiaceae bacterium]
MSFELSEPTEAVLRAAQAVSSSLRIVGGTGLALLLGHRRSANVDLFVETDEPLRPVIDAVSEAARQRGGTVTPVRTTPRFHRLDVRSGDETVRIDVANDASPRLDRGVAVRGLVVESLRDQRANKLVAALGRSELRDLVDLYFIERAGLPALEGLDDALSKDGGMDPAWLAWALDQIEIDELPGMIADLPVTALAAYRDRLRDRLLDRAGAGQP